MPQEQADVCLSGVSVKFARKTGGDDLMFGLVTTATSAEALKKQGFRSGQRQVQLADRPSRASANSRHRQSHSAT